MHNPKCRRLLGTFAILVLVTIKLGGCGAETPPPAEVIAVDPRFESAEAMTKYFNEVMMSHSFRGQEFADSIYAENDYQRMLLGIIKTSIPIVQFSTEIYDQFGQPLFESSEDLTYRPITKAASLVKTEDRRAEGIYFDEKRKETRLYLVEADHRWWVSGYTLEYTMDVPPQDSDTAALQELVSAMAEVTAGVRSRHKSGEFATAAEATQAMQVAILGYVMQHPDRFVNFRRMMEQGRDPFADSSDW